MLWRLSRRRLPIRLPRLNRRGSSRLTSYERTCWCKLEQFVWKTRLQTRISYRVLLSWPWSRTCSWQQSLIINRSERRISCSATTRWRASFQTWVRILRTTKRLRKSSPNALISAKKSSRSTSSRSRIWRRRLRTLIAGLRLNRSAWQRTRSSKTWWTTWTLASLRSSRSCRLRRAISLSKRKNTRACSRKWSISVIATAKSFCS